MYRLSKIHSAELQIRNRIGVRYNAARIREGIHLISFSLILKASLIQWAAHRFRFAIKHMSVNHGRFDIFMTEQFLHCADIVTSLE